MATATVTSVDLNKEGSIRAYVSVILTEEEKHAHDFGIETPRGTLHRVRTAARRALAAAGISRRAGLIFQSETRNGEYTFIVGGEW